MWDRAGRHRALSLIVGFVLIVAACGGSGAQPAPPDASAPAAAAPAPSQAPGTNGAKPAVETAKPPAARGAPPPPRPLATPVDFETLKTLLPEVAGWTRASTSGETVSLPVPHTSAYARYSKDTSTIYLEIGDSALSPVVLGPATMFMTAGFEERSDAGYRKAVTIRGFPGCEDVNTHAKTADLTVVVANRFVVHAKGREMTNIDPVRAVVQAVNLAALAKLK